MNANELADEIEQAIAEQEFATSKSEKWHKNIATMLRQQQAEIEALKKQCLDEIFKTTYADQNAKVMEQYWTEAQAEIGALKRKLQEAIDCAESEMSGGGINWYAYATEWKAILRKAQEK